MFNDSENTLQRICAFTFWLNKVASAATDVAIGESLSQNPQKDLEEALSRLHFMSREWIWELNPLWSPNSVDLSKAIRSGANAVGTGPVDTGSGNTT